MAEYKECPKCGSSQFTEGTLNHFAECPQHPNKLAAERLQAINAKKELNPDKTVEASSNEYTDKEASHGGTIFQPAMFTTPPLTFKGEMELKLSEESAKEAFKYYLTTVMSTPNIEVISVTKNAKKEFVVRFKGA